jgi:hypothetical protein
MKRMLYIFGMNFLLICHVANVHAVTVNISECSLQSTNSIAFDSFQTNNTYDLTEEFSINNKEKERLKRNLNFDEITVDPTMVKDQKVILSILNQEFREKASDGNPSGWGHRRYEWSSGVRLTATGTMNETHMKIRFDASKVNFIPELNTNNSLDYVEALLKDKIVNTQVLEYGTIVIITLNCSGVGLEMWFEVAQENMKCFLGETDEFGCVFEREDLKLSTVSLDLSKQYPEI